MSLQITNIEELKNSKIQIAKEKELYQDTLLDLENAIKETQITWNGNESDDFREKTLAIVNKLKNVENEMTYEVNYLDKIIVVLENAQEQVKNRLNVEEQEDL